MLPSSPVVLLFGLPRSGTSWVGKVFDSHPDTLYRHEPDKGLRAPSVPQVIPASELDTYRPAVEAYIEQVLRTRSVSVSGKLPIFPKRYYTPMQYRIRKVTAVTAKVWAHGFGDVPAPEFVDATRADNIHLVWKSIVSVGRLGVFLRVMPNARAILMLRHPCGQIASVRRGERQREFVASKPSSEYYNILQMLVNTKHARPHGLTIEALRQMEPIERQAWSWVLFHENVLADVEGLANCLTVRYEDICRHPVSTLRRLLEFCGLDWQKQTERFVEMSTTVEHRAYYGVMKNPLSAAYKWREQLTAAEIDRIKRIALSSRAGQLYEDDWPPDEGACSAPSVGGAVVRGSSSASSGAPAMVTAPAQFPPEAFLIGAQKAGTTSLAFLLDQHPGITLSNPKEPNFFTRNWDRGLDWYRGVFAVKPGSILLDASPSYTTAPLKGTCPHGDSDPLCGVPARIHGVAPRARFIYLLRDPVTRTYSSYWHSVRQGKNISFSEAIRDEDGFLLRTSDYYGQLQKYLEFFPLESFLFLVFEDMTADPAAAARRCFTFLGVEPRDFSVSGDSAKKNVSFTYRPAAIMLRQLFPSWSSWNEFVESAKEHTPKPLRPTVATLFTRKIPPMGQEDRQRLIEYFREPNARLEQLTGIRFNRWQR